MSRVTNAKQKSGPPVSKAMLSSAKKSPAPAGPTPGQLGSESAVRDNNPENGTEISDRSKEKLTIEDIMKIRIIKASSEKRMGEILDGEGYQVIMGAEGHLGKGGFGVVKKALMHRKNDKEVAVKILRLEKVEDGKKQKGTRLTDVKYEIENMDKLRENENIITLIDYFAVNNQVVIVMEYADGKTLNEFAKKMRGIDEKRSGRWFWEMASAIHFMHTKGIAHRDLKLENVLLKKPEPNQPGSRHVRIVDFGLSRECFTQEKGVHLFAGHAGTRPYMAPEIIQWSVDKDNAKKYNPMACDVWALGVCLYSMLTSTYPFSPPATANQLKNMKENGFRTKRLPEGVRELVQLMLEPHPAKRITSAGILTHPWSLEKNGKPNERRLITDLK